MTVPFKNIPTTTRLPLFYAELDPSLANTAVNPQRALLIGQRTGTGTVLPNVPVVSQSQSDSRAACGSGSILSQMVDAYRAADPIGEMWVLPLSDDGTAVAATGSITFTGPTTAAGVLSLYVAGRLIATPILAGQTAAQIAATINAALTATRGLPVTNAVDGVNTAKINLTMRNGGLGGNDVDLRVNFRGANGGEALPPGLGVTFVAMSGGVANPSLTTALGNLQDTSFDFIVCSLTDASSLAALAALLNDTNGRWSYSSQVYGHCFVATRGTAGAAAAFATGLNNQHFSCIPVNDSPTPPWKWAAAFAGAAAVSLRADPGVPLQFLSVPGILAPPLASRFSQIVRATTLIYGGCSTWTVDANGTVTMENIITTYVVNAEGSADNSYLEIETMFLIMYVLRRLSAMVTLKYSRVKLAADGTRLLPGSLVVTPAVIKADIIALYRQMEAEGFVQKSADFAAALAVEKDLANPNRVNILLPATLINQLRVFAVLMQFRLI